MDDNRKRLRGKWVVMQRIRDRERDRTSRLRETGLFLERQGMFHEAMGKKGYSICYQEKCSRRRLGSQMTG